MERIAIRELRNQASRVVRRALAGERIVITVNGIPAAQIGPLDEGTGGRSLNDLIASGQVLPPRTTAPAEPPEPVRGAGRTTTAILEEQRSR